MVYVSVEFVFFFKQKTAYEMRICDWSSDVCSSDLSSVSRSPAAWAVKAARAVTPRLHLPAAPGPAVSRRRAPRPSPEPAAMADPDAGEGPAARAQAATGVRSSASPATTRHNPTVGRAASSTGGEGNPEQGVGASTNRAGTPTRAQSRRRSATK